MKRLCLLLGCLVAISFAASAAARTLHYQVTVTVTGAGRVTAPAPDSTSGSIDCPGTCSALMKQNTTVTFTAAPNAGATFSGWGGDCASAGTSLTCSVSMTGEGSNGSKSITAGFGTAPPPPTNDKLTVRKIGTARGFVGGAGIDCGTVCSESLVQGTTLSLLAVPTGQGVFLGWGLPCFGAGRCTLTLNADTKLTATFADPRRPYVATLPGTAARGAAMLLRFHAWDSKGRAREALTVMTGTATLARAMVPMRPVTFRRIYSVRWLVPQSVAAGVDRYCAVAYDQAGKRSPKSCSLITIT